MEKINTEYFAEKFSRLQSTDPGGPIQTLREEGFQTFHQAGLPTRKTEEWRYTSVSDLFRKEYLLSGDLKNEDIKKDELEGIRLPGSEKANELVFVNGRYRPESSVIRTPEDQMVILPLEEAVKGKYGKLVQEHLGKSSLYYSKDGVHALNTSFIYGGLFIYVSKKQVIENPIFLYHLSDASQSPSLSQPRTLVYVDEGAKLQLVETYHTSGAMDHFTNEVIEGVVASNAILEYYKIQNDVFTSSQVGTTHIRQIGKSYVHTLVITLSGGMIRNNTNIIMEAPGNEAHMYGLYLLNGHSHVDNHTLVDNRQPNCFSNEFYKGVMDDHSSGVFSGKIYVRPDAQKTNAYQTNNNILLSDEATVNTKPQLEIYADDVKCSHGCTVGRLDEEALFYLRTRGISREHAQAMLLEAYAAHIVEQVKLEPLRKYVSQLIVERLSD